MADDADYAAKLTCRSRLTLLPDIRNKFRGTPRLELFRDTCFGWLLNLDDMQEACCLIHHFSCHQLLRDEGDTEIVPFTYSINNFEVQFGREEFCLVTGFRFGKEFSSDYESGPNLFRRRVFESSSDSKEITVRMLLEKFYSKEFDDMNDLDAVRISLLCVLETVLIGHELRYNVPGWCFRLVENIDAWNIYPWGSYIWTPLYEQLRDAINLRWEAHFVAKKDPKKGPPKYSLMGFTWAFKTWILEAFREGALIYFRHQTGNPRSVAWRYRRRFLRKYIVNFLDTDVNQHRPRLTPNAVEAESEWWRLSKSFFDGDNTVPPVIPPPKNQHSRDDNLWKQHHDLLKEHDKKINYIFKAIGDGIKPSLPKGPAFDGQPSRLSDFRNFQNTQADQACQSSPGPSFFEGNCFPPPQFTTPIYEQSVPPQYSFTFTRTTHTGNAMPQGVGQWSSNYQSNVDPTSVGGPTHYPNVGGVYPEANNRPRRECRPGVFNRDPYTGLPDTTVVPKKRSAKTKNKKVTDQIPRLDLNVADENEDGDDVTITGHINNGSYLTYNYNVDPSKVERNIEEYASFNEFLAHPEPIYLDCHLKGLWCMPKFFQELLPYLFKNGTHQGPNKFKIGWLSDEHVNAWMELLIRFRRPDDNWTVAKSGTAAWIESNSDRLPVLSFDNEIRGMLNGRTPPYPSWDNILWVLMPFHICGDHWVTAIINLHDSTFNVHDSMVNPAHRKDVLMKVAEWTDVLNQCLTKLGHFERTGRQLYNFSVNYNNYGYAIPQQTNGSDCGVITCWLISQFIVGRWPPLFDSNDVTKFFASFRISMGRKFYECRCESTSDCGYDEL